MMSINWILWQCLFNWIGLPLVASIEAQLPVYNPVTRCHDLSVPDDPLGFALCLQRGPDKQHPYNLHTAPLFCSLTYPPHGHLIELSQLSSDLIDYLLQSLTKLLNAKAARIDRPEPNFLWISANWTETSFDKQFLCLHPCQSKNNTERNLILKTRCQSDNHSRSCLTTRHTHWDRAPFVCLFNQTTIPEKKSVSSSPPPVTPPAIVPQYSNETIIFHDDSSCVVARSRTHQYTFCFRRQSCSLSQTSAFCTTRTLAEDICVREKNQSQLLTIENDDEYRLINDIVSYYSNETLLNTHGRLANKHILRAQWMWIGGIRNINDLYQWNIGNQSFVPIADHHWCERMSNCSGGQGRDHVVLNIVCQSKDKTQQVCLASRRASEPGPFICKRVLTNHEEFISNFTYLHKPVKAPIIRTAPTSIVPVYEKNSTSIYYDEHHCLTVQSLTHLYTFCFRRQPCALRKAYCTKWSKAQEECQLLKDKAQLLTIENDQERALISDVVDDYQHETRLTYNGSSYRYFVLAHYLWMDGVQQGHNDTYHWKENREVIPEHLWCPADGCDSKGRDRVTLNILCKKNGTAVCLGTSIQWKLAPYACKRPRPRDHCPILFEKIRSIHSSEMLVVTVNRTIALIKCKHPDYNTEIRVQYECEMTTSRWILTYENDNYTCPNYEVPPMALSINVSQSIPRTALSTSTRSWSSSVSVPVDDCASSEHSEIIARLPTQSRYISGQTLPPLSPSYYDRRFTCRFNHSIQITYRCELNQQRWIYVYGVSNDFRRCYPPCGYEERNQLLDKYFTTNERSQIRINRRRHQTTLRLRCFNDRENRWNSIIYSCGSLSLSKEQWFKLHACFDARIIPILPSVTVSMIVTERPLLCPPIVPYGSPCEYQWGRYLTDVNGCARKVCPQLSQLCQTIRCPPDRICRVIPCTSCPSTDYLQAVCEYSSHHH